MQSRNVLMYDAVQVLAKAMDELATIEGFNVDPVSCGQDRPWRDGQKIIKYIKRVRNRFLQDPLEFLPFVNPTVPATFKPFLD